MPTRKLSLKAVQAWMRKHGKGYAAAAAHFGVPEIQLRQLKQGITTPGPGRGGAEPYPGDLDESYGSPDEGPELTLGDTFTAPEMPDLDWAHCTPEDFLKHRLEHALKLVKIAVDAGSPNVARNWEVIAQRTRADLDATREAQRVSDEAKGRSELADPAAIARRITSKARELASVAPEECVGLLHALAKQLRLRVVREDEFDAVPVGQEVQDPGGGSD